MAVAFNTEPFGGKIKIRGTLMVNQIIKISRRRRKLAVTIKLSFIVR